MPSKPSYRRYIYYNKLKILVGHSHYCFYIYTGKNIYMRLFLWVIAVIIFIILLCINMCMSMLGSMCKGSWINTINNPLLTNYFLQKFLPPWTARIWLIYFHIQPNLTSTTSDHHIVERLCRSLLEGWLILNPLLSWIEAPAVKPRESKQGKKKKKNIGFKGLGSLTWTLKLFLWLQQPEVGSGEKPSKW